MDNSERELGDIKQFKDMMSFSVLQKVIDDKLNRSLKGGTPLSYFDFRTMGMDDLQMLSTKKEYIMRHDRYTHFSRLQRYRQGEDHDLTIDNISVSDTVSGTDVVLDFNRETFTEYASFREHMIAIDHEDIKARMQKRFSISLEDPSIRVEWNMQINHGKYKVDWKYYVFEVGARCLIDKRLGCNIDPKENQRRIIKIGRKRFGSEENLPEILQRTIEEIFVRKTSNERLLEDILDAFPPLTDEEREELGLLLDNFMEVKRTKPDEITLNSMGFTSYAGFSFKERFLKIDNSKRMLAESIKFKAISSMLYRAKNFIPVFYNFSSTENLSVLVMDDVNHRIPGYQRANVDFKGLLQSPFTHNSIAYNIFLMGLLHKETTDKSTTFAPLIYEGVHGLPYFEEGQVPKENIEGFGYKMFKDTMINSDQVCKRILDHKENQEKNGFVILHGDWKKDNLPNGYLVDFAMVGRGFEVDELAYFLSDIKMGCSISDFHSLLDMYVSLRSIHDSEFAAHPDYHRFLHSIAEDAFLTQLVLRHGVMNKRDMNDPEKFQQRQYYQHRIKEMI
ncbi:hypothetical protein H6503_03085 [Candidatus Woesearchaeota archaeon]|nr:hypothetical protein [Candidatus Woesearchaeota archaeon]